MQRAAYCLCLLAVITAIGAMLTIGVAWGCILWSPAENPRPSPQFGRGDHPAAKSISRFGKFDGYTVFEHRGAGWEIDYVIATPAGHHHRDPPNPNNLARASAGWPWLCMEGERRTISGQTTEWRLMTLPSLPRADGMRRAHVPLSPLWPAFIANTGVYATFALVVMIAVVLGKRSYLYWTNRCPRCGYQLRGLPPVNGGIRCPECGRSVKRPLPIS